MRGVMHLTSLEIHPMLIVDCPLCERPAPFDAEADALECDGCGVRLELAATTPDPISLPAAA
jgi:hypothetical protein